MGQILVRQVDDAAVARLKLRAKERRTSLEAIAREAIHKAAAELSTDEKRALVDRIRAKYVAATMPGAARVAGLDLIREDRDR